MRPSYTGPVPEPQDRTGTAAGDDLHELVAGRLAGASLRYTAARRRVVDALAAAGRPVTLPEILRHDRSLAQSSTYRHLTELIGAGVVHRIVAADEHGHYELAEDLTSHHHHLVCTRCGGVADFHPAAGLEAQLDRAIDRVARRHGFRPDGHRLDVVGTCADCA